MSPAAERPSERRCGVKRPKGAARALDRLIVGRWEVLWVAWWWRKWRGISLPAWFDSRKRERPAVYNLKPEEMAEMKRPDVKCDELGQVSIDLPAANCLIRFPRVSEAICQGTWDDDSGKGQRCLMVFIDGALVRVLLKFETPALKLSTVGRSLDEALGALDALLGASDVPWESDIPRDQRSSKKRR